MVSQFGARLAAVYAARAGLLERGKLAVAMGALALASCSPDTLPTLAGPDPADPSVAVAPAAYRSSTTSYRSIRPSEPTGWTQQNDAVTSPPRNGGKQ